MVRKLYIVRGIPGSGKTTFVKEDLIPKLKLFTSEYAISHYEADMYFMEGEEYKFDPTKLKDAHQWCLQSVKDAFEKQRKSRVIVSNTFTRFFEMEPYINYCKENKIQFSVQRMNGNYKSVHNVPEETIAKMRERFEDYPGEISYEQDA